MAKSQKGSKTQDPADSQVEEIAGEGVREMTIELDDQAPAQASAGVPVEGTSKPAKVKKEKPPKPEIPVDQQRGNRVCAACGTQESKFLEKNARYSLCQGVDVYCYRKGDRVIYGKTLSEVEALNPGLVGKVDKNQKPMIESVAGTGIKPGILVREAMKRIAPKKEKAPEGTGTSAAAPVEAAAEGTGSTTSASTSA